MQARAYEGYFDNGRFYASGKAVKIPEKQRVIITILDDAPSISTVTSAADKKAAAQHFLSAVQKLREEGFTPEDDDTINEFQSGAYKVRFEERL